MIVLLGAWDAKKTCGEATQCGMALTKIAQQEHEEPEPQQNVPCFPTTWCARLVPAKQDEY